MMILRNGLSKECVSEPQVPESKCCIPCLLTSTDDPHKAVESLEAELESLAKDLAHTRMLNGEGSKL